MKILIHLTQGPENPTVAALAFLMARTALQEGHDVNLFLAGDAVTLMRDALLDNVSGLGTGKLREHYDEVAKSRTPVYLSAMSSRARGMTEVDVAGKLIEFAPPSLLLKLAIESEKMFVY